MLRVRCKSCNTEITSNNKAQCCGCPNRMIVHGDTVTANDLSELVLLNSEKNLKSHGILTKGDLEYQENRRKRQVRKLHFEER